jgi:hypothetical protein
MEMAVFLSLSLVVVPEGLIIQGDGCLLRPIAVF